MADEEMVEAGARALFSNCPAFEGQTFDNAADSTKRAFISDARACLTAANQAAKGVE